MVEAATEFCGDPITGDSDFERIFRTHLPAGAKRRVGLHPLESAALSRRTPIAAIAWG